MTSERSPTTDLRLSKAVSDAQKVYDILGYESTRLLIRAAQDRGPELWRDVVNWPTVKEAEESLARPPLPPGGTLKNPEPREPLKRRPQGSGSSSSKDVQEESEEDLPPLHLGKRKNEEREREVCLFPRQVVLKSKKQVQAREDAWDKL